jgi:SAM-dependent methyltransferase
MAADTNQEQAEFWDELAPDWAEVDRQSSIVAGPFGDAAMARLAGQHGEHVLDIGCGTGDTTLALAAMVAPDGSALGADIAPGMVEIARRRHADSSARFEVVDVQVASIGDLGGRPFDAAFSRFGVMFFDDRTAAFANIRALLRPGGRLAFTCWQDVFSNEWMFVPGAAVVEVTGELPPMPGPGEPGPFSLADPDEISTVLGDAGFVDVEITPTNREVDLSQSAAVSLLDLIERVGPVREALRDADAEVRTRILGAVRAALDDRVVDGRLRLSAAAHVVSATAG